MLFDHPEFDGHGQVQFIADSASGLRAILAVHRVREGRSVGGVRMRAYGSDVEALTDALRLSKAMTVKAALADLPFGGAKTVIIGDPARDKAPTLFHALGRHFASLGGLYHCGPDVGTGAAEMDVIAEEFEHVGATTAQGGSSAPPTAFGVFQALRATAQHLFGTPDLAGRTVAVQGAGGVGAALAPLLIDAGAKVLIADVDEMALAAVCRRTGACAVPAGDIMTVAADILAPCALGGVLDAHTIPQLRVRGVCGAANNQLAAPEDGDRLMEREIAYVPDAVASAGGIIDGLARAGSISRARSEASMAGIFDTALSILRRSAEERRSAEAIAHQLARERLGDTA